MNQILARYSVPRLDLFTAGGNRINISLPAIGATIPAQNWLYARVDPSTAAARINPVTHALTGCAGVVDGSKANMSKIGYLFVLAEAIEDEVGQADWISVNYSAGADNELFQLRRDILNNHPAWTEVINTGGGTETFTGSQTILFNLSELDPNLRLHLLMGCLQ